MKDYLVRRMVIIVAAAPSGLASAATASAPATVSVQIASTRRCGTMFADCLRSPGGSRPSTSVASSVRPGPETKTGKRSTLRSVG